MSTGHLHLARRGALYQWRARLPLTLASALDRSHLARSLRTADPRVARHRARLLTVEIDKLEHSLMNKPVFFEPSKLQLRLVLEDIFNCILAESENRRDVEPEGTPRFPRRDDIPAVESTTSFEMSDNDWAKHFEESDAGWERAPHPQDLAKFWTKMVETNNTRSIQPILQERLAAHGLKMTTETPEYQTFSKDATRLVSHTHEISWKRWLSDFDGNQGMPSFIEQKYPLDSELLRTWTSRLDQGEARFLSRSIEDVAKEFAEQRQQQGTSRKTQFDDDMAIRYFIDLTENIQIQHLTPSHAEKFANKLLEVPREFGKGIYAKILPSQAIELANDLKLRLNSLPDGTGHITIGERRMTVEKARAKCERMRKKTANKHLTFFTSLWRSSLVPRSLRVMNPFEGSLYSKEQIDRETASRGTRVAFAQAELKILFSGDIWNGCQRPFHEEETRQSRMTPWKYWCPLIALFTGVRREEVARLRPDDFDTSNDVWLLRIQATHGRHLKSKAGIRDIPIHSRLVKLGLKDFVDGSERGQPLFPELRPTGAYKEHGEQLGKWFRTYRHSLDLKSAHTDFHSLRHSFVHCLRDGGVPIDLIALLVGHEYGGITANIYGRQVSIRQKQEALERLNLGDIFAKA